jgi:hypothetical protein
MVRLTNQTDRPRIYGFSGYRLLKVSLKLVVLSTEKWLLFVIRNPLASSHCSLLGLLPERIILKIKRHSG